MLFLFLLSFLWQHLIGFYDIWGIRFKQLFHTYNGFDLKWVIFSVSAGCDSQHLVEVHSWKPPKDSDLRSVHFSSPDPSVSKASSRRFLDRSSKERLNSIQCRAKRLTVSSSNSTLNGRSLGGSNDTLKAAGSISEFSQHSGDPELEFDLYDCDLNNASAMPGSYFAPAYSWDCDYDVTPTGEEEEFELSDFFPGKLITMISFVGKFLYLISNTFMANFVGTFLYLISNTLS